MNSTMPRPPSENTFQVTFKIPDAWIAQADALASAMSRPGLTITRTDALRQALAKGLDVLGAEIKKAGRK
jgi:hypothetical protein